jgi:hypothetical protein
VPSEATATPTVDRFEDALVVGHRPRLEKHLEELTAHPPTLYLFIINLALDTAIYHFCLHTDFIEITGIMNLFHAHLSTGQKRDQIVIGGCTRQLSLDVVQPKGDQIRCLA